jgi:hypothetical protein
MHEFSDIQTTLQFLPDCPDALYYLCSGLVKNATVAGLTYMNNIHDMTRAFMRRPFCRRMINIGSAVLLFYSSFDVVCLDKFWQTFLMGLRDQSLPPIAFSK